MASYRLTPFARSQLLAIHEFTESNFGRAQADKYHAGFRHIFELIAHFPGMGRRAGDLRPGLRRYRHQSHYTFYSQESGRILIRFIYHTAQNLNPDLFK